MDNQLEKQEIALNTEKNRAKQKSLKIVEVNEKAIKHFVETHGGDSNEKHWVLYNIRWAGDYPLFTFGGSTCLIPVFINNTTGQIGLGHLPYVFVDHEKLKIPKTKEEAKFEEARNRLSNNGPDWEMLLFGGKPYDESEKAKRLSEINAKKVIKMFSKIGVKCTDYTSKDPKVGIEGIIVDPNILEVQVCYSETEIGQ